MTILHGILAIIVFLSLGILLSENRRAIRLIPLFVCLFIQFILAILLFKLQLFLSVFSAINQGVLALNHATLQGTGFVFGYVGGAPLPFKLNGHGSTFNLAFQAMPMVMVISALSALLFYVRILPVIIKGVSYVVSKSLGLGGALATAVSANLFIGMAESPLVIRPYLHRLSRSELFTLMTCGMAGVAGTVMALYVFILNPIMHGVMHHIVAAVLITVPAVVLMSKIIVPETTPVTEGHDVYVEPSLSAIDALLKGVKVGGEILISILSVLIVLVALVACADALLNLLPAIYGHKVSLEYLLGFIFEPFMWLMGIPWNQAHIAGNLMATRMVLNELVSYQQLAHLPAGALDAKSQLIMIYAMCGFANISGLGIMLATYNVLIPERRKEFVSLGLKALLAGTICTCMTGTFVGLLSGLS